MMLHALLLVGWLTFGTVAATNIGNTRNEITLGADGGYKFLIAIDDNLEENRNILTAIQNYITQASMYLLIATKQRVYFKDITILVPRNWSHDASWQEPTRNETFKKARVLVASKNPAWGDTPYTLQPGLCGEEGDYIHLTVDYLMNFTAKTRRFVREFAHLRYGVFDESPLHLDPNAKQHYTEDNDYHPVRCTTKISGRWSDITTKENCDLTQDEVSGQYITDTCHFQPRSASSATASLMYAEDLDGIVEFCSTKGNATSNNIHNILGLNRQNAICKRKSVWDVLNLSDDFDIDYNTVRNGADPPAPIFKVVQHGSMAFSSTTTTEKNGNVNVNITSHKDPQPCNPEMICFALDISGSMNTKSRITAMANALIRYFQTDIPQNSVAGIVQFDDKAEVNAPMTVVTSESERSTLASAVPTIVRGYTGIGGGLDKCRTMLVDYALENDKELSFMDIIVISDGEENRAPLVAEILPKIVENGITVYPITFSQEADNVMIKLSEQTGGKPYFAGDNTATDANKGETQIYEALISPKESECDSEPDVVILRSGPEILPADGSIIYRTIFFDATIGENTTFVFKYNNPIEVKVISEQNLNIRYEHDTKLKTITAYVDGRVTEMLEYSLQRTDLSAPEAIVEVLIKSMTIPGVEPIVVNTVVNNNDIEFGPKTLLVSYVHIFQGLTPILELQVKAVMETPDGAESSINYNDNGKGKDSTPNDGVYTGMFSTSQFTDGGKFYRLSVVVSGNGTLPQATTNGRRRRRNVAATLGQIIRTSPGMLITVNNFNASIGDSTPPEDINDLRIAKAPLKDSDTFTLRWTAPGDDVNIGKVSTYEFAVTNQANLSSFVTIPQEAILANTTALLVDGGETLELKVNLSYIKSELFNSTSANSDGTYYFKLRTTDDKGNAADWSNPAPATIIDPLRLYLITPAAAGAIPIVEPTTTTAAVNVVMSVKKRDFIFGFSVGSILFISLVVAAGFLTIGLCKANDGKLYRYGDNPTEVTIIPSFHHRGRSDFHGIHNHGQGNPDVKFPSRHYPAYINRGYSKW